MRLTVHIERVVVEGGMAPAEAPALHRALAQALKATVERSPPALLPLRAAHGRLLSATLPPGTGIKADTIGTAVRDAMSLSPSRKSGG